MKKGNRARVKHIEVELKKDAQGFLSNWDHEGEHDSGLDLDFELFDDSEFPQFQKIRKQSGRSENFSLDEIWNE